MDINDLTLEIFMGDIFAINPEGNPTDTFARLIFHITERTVPEGHEKPTYELIKERYHDYIKVWNYRWLKKEQAGFLPKDQVKKTLYEFLGDSPPGYELIHQIPKGNQDREEYLFGTEPRKELYDKADQFRKKYNI
jgi:hypothetical protein